jgi:ribosomal protein S18 acetylase RimI-like enzyme
MKIQRYKLFADFERVHKFLTDTYNPDTLNSYLLPQVWEYAHHTSFFDSVRASRMGLWEDDGNIVGIAVYEMEIGEVFLHTNREYENLLPDLLNWAENELSVKANDKQHLSVWITDKEQNKAALLKQHGYACVHREPVRIFPYNRSFSEKILPDGFVMTDGINIDYGKLADCFWRGFNNPQLPPDNNTDEIMQFCNAPRAKRELMRIIKSPEGNYACALVMWLDEQNHYAYLEPLAVVPEYRRMGLATIALTDAMKKTKEMGAKYCFGGVPDFYTAIGFETVCTREIWEKE